jgi:hypothetical protein
MTTRHFLKPVRQNLFSVQHTGGTGAKRGIDGEDYIMVALAHANALVK